MKDTIVQTYIEHYINKIINFIYRKKPRDKLIKSVVAVGDVIEILWLGKPEIYTVENIEVILNNPHYTPIDLVIKVKLSYNNGKSSIECCSNNFEYVKHIYHAK